MQAAEPDPLGHLMQMIREQGDVVQYRSGYGPVHLFNHPDHVQAILQNSNFQRTALLKMVTGDGLLASDGRHWQTQRRLLQPSFHERCMAGFGSMISQSAMAMLHRWEQPAESGQELDIGAETKRLTLEIILKVLFDDITQHDVIRMAEAARVLMQHLGDLSDVLLHVPLVIDPRREERFRVALEVMDAMVHELTGRMKSTSDGSRGIVPSLLEARNAGTLTDQQVRDEIVTMIIAGHETTAIALAWTMHFLSMHAEVQARLVDEVDAVLETRAPSLDDLPNLPYTRMVFDEAMRLYPPVSLVVRQAVTEDVVGGYKIPAGGLAILSAYTTHRHPEFWSEPERFDPERFHPERSRDRHRFAYFPFLGGRHQCIGQGLATMEGPLILALLIKHVHIRMKPRAAIHPLPGMALRVKDGFPATVEFRKPLPSC